MAVHVRINDKVTIPEHGTFIVSRYRWYRGLGVAFYDQDNEFVTIVPFMQEVSVS